VRLLQGLTCAKREHLAYVACYRYAASLKKRILWLESIVRARCPDVDLEQGPSVTGDTESSPQTASEMSGDPRCAPSNRPAGGAGLPSAAEGPSTDRATRLAEVEEVTESQSRSNLSANRSEGLAHSIGLVSLSPGTDLRYVGPSSSYFFAQLVLACAAREGQRTSALLNRGRESGDRGGALASMLSMDVFRPRPSPLPSNKDQTVQLSLEYFDTIHLQYPFLHKPSHLKTIDNVYNSDSPNAMAVFHVNMVLAIAATGLSRRLNMPIPAEGFYTKAMEVFDQVCLESSLAGLQALLLLMIFALNNTAIPLNRWYLSYQCIAAAIDLGLQRDVRAGNGISILNQELRTRAFWVTYSVDRSLATIMGRPLGLRDEGCDLRVSLHTTPHSISRKI